MKKTLLLLSIFGLSLALPASAQVLFKGNFRLGDTTQVHILNTKNGDRLAGRVVAFDEGKITFLFKNSSRLEFATGEIISVEVEGAPADPRPAAPEKTGSSAGFNYLVTLSNGNEESGELFGYLDREFRLKRDPGTDSYLLEKNISDIHLLSPTLEEGILYSRLHILKTKRGDQFAGQVLKYDSSGLNFLSKAGAVLKFDLSEIRGIWLQNVQIRAERPDPKAPVAMQGQGRLFAAPTGFLLKKGEREYRNVGIFVNTLDYGASDNVTLGVGLMPLIGINVLSFRGKVGGNLSDFVHVTAGGQLMAYTVIEEGAGVTGMGFASISVGKAERFLTLGFSRGYLPDGYNELFSSVHFGGSFRVGNRWRLLAEFVAGTEHYEQFGSDSGWSFIFCASRFGNGHQFDFGMMPFFDGYYAAAVPVLAYSYKF